MTGGTSLVVPARRWGRLHGTRPGTDEPGPLDVLCTCISICMRAGGRRLLSARSLWRCDLLPTILAACVMGHRPPFVTMHAAFLAESMQIRGRSEGGCRRSTAGLPQVVLRSMADCHMPYFMSVGFAARCLSCGVGLPHIVFVRYRLPHVAFCEVGIHHIFQFVRYAYATY